MATYTLHNELVDATCETAFHTVSNKRLALQIARLVAKDRPWGVANLLVCKDDMTVASFPIRPVGSREDA